MKFKTLLLLLFTMSFFSCKKEIKSFSSSININDSIPSDKAFDSLIKPYKLRLDEDMNTILSYAPETYSKTIGEYNTAIGNLMADIVYSQGNKVFSKRTNKNIDAVLLNHGGIRATISKGNITTKTAFEVMPFENNIVVVALKGQQLNSMMDYLRQAKRAHPVSGMELQMDKDFNITKALIQGKKIDKKKTYYLATNDYLYDGGDRMRFFKPNDSVYYLDYKIRNAMIDYFKKVDTIHPKIDNRFTQTK